MGKPQWFVIKKYSLFIESHFVGYFLNILGVSGRKTEKNTRKFRCRFIYYGDICYYYGFIALISFPQFFGSVLSIASFFGNPYFFENNRVNIEMYLPVRFRNVFLDF